MRVYVCIQNSGSLKVKETELVETEKKKKTQAGQMDSEPNTYKHGRFMSAGVYISAACLKTQQRAELDTALVSQFASASVQRGKRKKEERFCDAFRLYQNILTTFDKSGIVQTPVLASIQLWKEEGSEKKKSN